MVVGKKTNTGNLKQNGHGPQMVPLSQPRFDHFVEPCFRGHDEAGLLAFEALQGLPRPARGTRTKRGSRGLESI